MAGSFLRAAGKPEGLRLSFGQLRLSGEGLMHGSKRTDSMLQVSSLSPAYSLRSLLPFPCKVELLQVLIEQRKFLIKSLWHF